MHPDGESSVAQMKQSASACAVKECKMCRKDLKPLWVSSGNQRPCLLEGTTLNNSQQAFATWQHRSRCPFPSLLRSVAVHRRRAARLPLAPRWRHASIWIGPPAAPREALAWTVYPYVFQIYTYSIQKYSRLQASLICKSVSKAQIYNG